MKITKETKFAVENKVVAHETIEPDDYDSVRGMYE